MIDAARIIAKHIYGRDPKECMAQGICVKCGQPAEFYSEAGRQEYMISALCEQCFDQIAEDEV